MKLAFKIKLSTYRTMVKRGLTIEKMRNKDFRNADFSKLDFRNASFDSASFYSASFDSASFDSASFDSASFYSASFDFASFVSARFDSASFYSARFYSASFDKAQVRALLRQYKNITSLAQRPPRRGAFTAWKKCNSGVLVKLHIPADAKRSSATGKKCRASHAVVIQVKGAEYGVSQHDNKTEYRIGQTVHCDKWENSRWIECGGGIHFFMSYREASAY